MKKTKLTSRRKYFVEFFDDYHEIRELKENLGSGWRCREVAFGPTKFCGYGLYWGLFWRTGNKPNKKKVRELLIADGLDINTTQRHYATDTELETEVY